MARVKTEAQKDAVLQAAIGVFREVGYDRASMNAVAERLGGSKATIYNYFDSKESLFGAAMHAAVKEKAELAFTLLDGEGELRDQLRAFANRYLAFNLEPEMIEIVRLSIAKGADGRVGSQLYVEGVERGWARVAEYLGERLSAEQLAPDGAEVAAGHLRALISGDFVDRRLRGVVGLAEPKALARHVDSAVDLFLRAYRA